TRGLEEPGYDPSEDLEQFDSQAHVIIVTVRALDHAVDNTLRQLRVIRARRPSRPVVLALTCLHEAYPGRQHPEPYPFLPNGEIAHAEQAPAWQDLGRSIAEQRQRFEGLYDHIALVDLTPPDEGFHNPSYGGAHLKEILIGALPAAY